MSKKAKPLAARFPHRVKVGFLSALCEYWRGEIFEKQESRGMREMASVSFLSL